MFPLSIPGLPNPYIILGALLAVVIAFAAGNHHGYKVEHEKFITFTAEVKAAGQLADAQHKATIANHEAVTQKVIADSASDLASLQVQADAALKVQQSQHTVEIAQSKQVTKDIQNEYEHKISAIHALYAGRLLNSHSNPSSGIVPSFSLTTPPAYDQSSYDVLARQCAITTRMLIGLQEWVAGEESVQ